MRSNRMKSRDAWSVYLAVGTACAVGAADQTSVTSSVVERGPHHKVIETVARQPAVNGRTMQQVSRRVELASGLHHHDGTRWIESLPLIEPHPDGAVAHHGQHKAAFSANLNTFGAIQVVDADGRKLTSHLLGLAYTDSASGMSGLIAEIKNSLGQILPPNQILYEDAFDTVRADVRYTYTVSGFEQDIIIKEALPDPRDFGLDPLTTRIEVLTEFIEAPAPTIQTEILDAVTDPAQRLVMVMPDFLDDRIKFGGLQVGKGKALDFQGVLKQEIPVGKTWEVSNGRKFLIEGVQLRIIAPAINALPQARLNNNNAARVARVQHPLNKHTVSRPYPAAPGERAAADRKPMGRMARTSAEVNQGVLLDYVMDLSGGLTNYTFRPDVTYHITGPVNLYGTNTIVGGTVFKFIPDYYDNSYLAFNGTIVCDTTPYRPAVFTAEDDNSIGGGAGWNELSGYYGVAAIRAASLVSGDLHDLRFLHAATAIDWTGGTNRFSNLQFINCSNAIRLVNVTNAPVHNVLARDVGTVFVASNSTINAQHLTASSVGTLASLSGSPAALSLTNCVLVSVGSLGTGTIAGDYAGTNDCPALSGVTHGFTALDAESAFSGAVGGASYLGLNGDFRDVGTTNLDARLRTELSSGTTYPPQYMTGTTTTDTTFTIVAQRDRDNPDLGYHYAPLDYVCSGYTVATNAALFLTNGVAVGIDYGTLNWGLVWDGGKVVSIGSPTAMNRIVRAHCVQESSAGNPGYMAMLYDDGAEESAHGNSEAVFRFTEFDQMTDDGYMIYVGHYWSHWEWSHSYLHNMSIMFQADQNGQNIGITNNVFRWADATFSCYGSSSAYHLRNNLFTEHNCNLSDGNTSWTVRDNMFANGIVYTAGASMDNSHNGYYNASAQIPGGTSDVVLTNLTFQTGPLGHFYLPTGTALLDAGSRNATNAGLYHFTTTTNQVKETNTVVDIGFHYVAVDAFGIPVDSDGDGIADFAEDRNGNGSVNSGETDWRSAIDWGLNVFITRPRSSQIIP